MEETLFGEKSLIFWLSITFITLLILLKKFAYGPILDTLDKRSQRIHDALDQAEKLKNDADQMFADYSKQLEEAKKEAQKIIDQGKKMGEQMKKEIIDKAKDQSDAMINRAEAEIQSKTDEAIRQLQGNVASLSVSIAEKVLRKNIDEVEKKRLTEDSILEMGQISGRN